MWGPQQLSGIKKGKKGKNGMEWIEIHYKKFLNIKSDIIVIHYYHVLSYYHRIM